jgi:hypothetical protein
MKDVATVRSNYLEMCALNLINLVQKVVSLHPHLIYALNLFYISFQQANKHPCFISQLNVPCGLWHVTIPKHNHRERIILHTVSRRSQ